MIDLYFVHLFHSSICLNVVNNSIHEFRGFYEISTYDVESLVLFLIITMDVRKQNIAYNVRTGLIKRKFEQFHQYQQYEQLLLLADH